MLHKSFYALAPVYSWMRTVTNTSPKCLFYPNDHSFFDRNIQSLRPLVLILIFILDDLRPAERGISHLSFQSQTHSLNLKGTFGL